MVFHLAKTIQVRPTLCFISPRIKWELVGCHAFPPEILLRSLQKLSVQRSLDRRPGVCPGGAHGPPRRQLRRALRVAASRLCPAAPWASLWAVRKGPAPASIALTICASVRKVVLRFLLKQIIGKLVLFSLFSCALELVFITL